MITINSEMFMLNNFGDEFILANEEKLKRFLISDVFDLSALEKGCSSIIRES